MQELYQQIIIRNRNPTRQQNELRVYSYNEVRVFQLDQKLLNLSINQIKTEFIHKNIGYSSRVHLYKEPLCSFNKIDYLPPSIVLKDIISQVGHVCLTYNNTQYSEQPDYNHQAVYSRPISAESIETVVQICQNNFFVHENYRVQQSTRIGFFRDICTRYGRNIYIKYYNLRLSIQIFANDSLVQHTISKIVDQMNRLTITVDSVQIGQMNDQIGNYLQKICKQEEIDWEFYFKLRVCGNGDDKYYVVSRKCKVEVLRYMLKMIIKQDVRLVNDENQREIVEEYVQIYRVVKVQISKQKPSILQLSTPISNCQLIGKFHSNNSTIYHMAFIQQSKILRTFIIDSESMNISPECAHILPCPPTTHLDEDLFFVRGNYIIGYTINISMVKIKYFDMSGELLYVRVWPWYQDMYGDIQFVVVDMFCVRIKQDKKKVRVFYIDDPQEYIDVSPCEKFYPARIANNTYSDGSGLFATTNQWCESVEIYSLQKKHKITEIKISNYKQLTDVFFEEFDHSIREQQRKVILNFGDKQLKVYNTNKGQCIFNVLCEKGMKNFTCIGQKIVCCSGSQLRIFYNGNQKQNLAKLEREKKEKDIVGFKWGQPIYIPQKSVIILPSGQFMVRQSILQFTNLTKVYILNQNLLNI